MKLTQLLLVAGLFVSNIAMCNKFTHEQTRVVFKTFCTEGQYDPENPVEGKVASPCINAIRSAGLMMVLNGDGKGDIATGESIQDVARKLDIKLVAERLAEEVPAEKVAAFKKALAELEKPAEPTTLWEAATRDDEPKAQTGSDELK